jgi:plastocyanin
MVNFSAFAFSTAMMATMAVAAPAYGADYKPSSSAAAYTPASSSTYSADYKPSSSAAAYKQASSSAYSAGYKPSSSAAAYKPASSSVPHDYGYKTSSSSAAYYKPTGTSQEYKPSPVKAAHGATHTVAVGRGGLRFEPNNIFAEIGDIVEYHYLPKNHSVAQSSFANPCVPSGDDAFFSGFMPTADGTQNANVFQIEVKDKNPIWFYCSQTAGNHCQSGMSGVINQNPDGPNNLSAYQKKAALTGTSVSPAKIGGGYVIPNPNPLAGL